eukprot:jgi/Botrbrau1/7713/Bobra.0159s0146.1
MSTQLKGINQFQKNGCKDFNSLQKVQEAGVQNQQMGLMTATCRLFVGNVPHTFVENDLRKWFEECGQIKQIIILKDKSTGLSRCAAFVGFATTAEADAAIAKFATPITLPGAYAPLEVRKARSQGEPDTSAPPSDAQIFFARAPPGISDEILKKYFTPFGKVVHLNHFKDRIAGISKGCGFVYYESRAEAEAAIKALHEKVTVEGGYATLTVKWADPSLCDRKRKAQKDLGASDNKKVFFARAPKSITEEQLRDVFGRYGIVEDVSIYRPYPTAAESKGCGIISMATHEDAVNIINELDLHHTWPGMDAPMVLRWVDLDLLKRRKEEQAPNGFVQHGDAIFMADAEPPPPGCDRDSIKLFVSNLPRNWDVDDIKPLLEVHGTVVSLHLLRDRITKESKGHGLLWYKRKIEAERALTELNCQVLDPKSNWKLKVVRARKKAPSGLLANNHGIYLPPHRDANSMYSDALDGPNGSRAAPSYYYTHQQPYAPYAVQPMVQRCGYGELYLDGFGAPVYPVAATYNGDPVSGYSTCVALKLACTPPCGTPAYPSAPPIDHGSACACPFTHAYAQANALGTAHLLPGFAVDVANSAYNYV